MSSGLSSGRQYMPAIKRAALWLIVLTGLLLGTNVYAIPLVLCSGTISNSGTTPYTARCSNTWIAYESTNFATQGGLNLEISQRQAADNAEITARSDAIAAEAAARTAGDAAESAARSAAIAALAARVSELEIEAGAVGENTLHLVDIAQYLGLFLAFILGLFSARLFSV